MVMATGMAMPMAMLIRAANWANRRRQTTLERRRRRRPQRAVLADSTGIPQRPTRRHRQLQPRPRPLPTLIRGARRPMPTRFRRRHRRPQQRRRHRPPLAISAALAALVRQQRRRRRRPQRALCSNSSRRHVRLHRNLPHFAPFLCIFSSWPVMNGLVLHPSIHCVDNSDIVSILTCTELCLFAYAELLKTKP